MADRQATVLCCYPQVIKVVFPVYYGSRYQCQKVPQHVFLKGMQQLDAEKKQKQQDHEQQLQAHKAAAAAVLCTSCRASALQRRSCAAEVAAAATTAALQPSMVM